MTRQDDQSNPGWKAIVRRLRALPEKTMRREVLNERLAVMTPEEALAFFSGVLSGVARRNDACMEVLDAVHESVLSGQEQGYLYEILAEVYRLARESGNQAVIRLLAIARPKRGPLSAKEVPGDLEMSRLTLGQRKFLARGHDRVRIDRLLYDPDPAVIRNLLRNPNLTEQDVIRLAARRPAREAVQRELYGSRWSDRYRVRLALVCNPYTPTDVSLKLLGFLLRKDLRMVSRDGGLHELVRAEAGRLLLSKSGGDTVGPDEEIDEEDPKDPPT
jgi:hypothetical protein